MDAHEKKIVAIKKLEVLLTKLKKSKNFAEKTEILETAGKLLTTLKE